MNLTAKYNRQAPRYTSYPTVPYWDNNLDEENWKLHLRKCFAEHNKDGISLYIHLPFCESLCTYCACNTRITVNHAVEENYIAALLKEWSLYLNEFKGKPVLKELHLGGGTPTFFSPGNLGKLIKGILETADISQEHEFSFEAHPANTSLDHLQVLYDLGFRRLSLGIQDFDEKVQDTINRYQSFEQVEQVILQGRKIGYSSVNLDVIYGLPFQTETTIGSTIEKVIKLCPERIAFYSYAHVPWMKPGQRKYSEKDLPQSIEKRKLYETGKDLFIRSGYSDIGMDHFALKNDALFSAFNNGTLHRNFMGYTPQHTKLLVGLGCSAISDTWDCFAQNIKVVEAYEKAVMEGRFPLLRGHVLDHDDLRIRQQILDLMCRHETELDTMLYDQLNEIETAVQLEEFVKDGLAEIKEKRIKITPKGRAFVRNICLAFDARYWKNQPVKDLFSTTA